MAEPLILLEGVTKDYGGRVVTRVLHGVDLAIWPGELAALIGPSGSGKSTLLNLLGCLDRPTAGSYVLGGRNVARLNDNQLSDVRAANIGFVFQSYNLIPQLTVVENIEVPLYYQGRLDAANRRRCRELARLVGLAERLNHPPRNCPAASSSEWPSLAAWPTIPTSFSLTSRRATWTRRRASKSWTCSRN